MRVGVTGGKGGTGKSFVAVNLATAIALKRGVCGLIDLDVEAPNDYILLGLDLQSLERVADISIPFPRLDPSKCDSCGVCAQVCGSGAIAVFPRSKPIFFPRLCSGCRACILACPRGALSESRRVVGSIYRARVPLDGGVIVLIEAVMREGEEHVAPIVVDAVRKIGRVAPIEVVDTGAGAGSHIVSSLRGCERAIIVTEPTRAALHDLELALRICRHLGLRTALVINKAGLGSHERHAELGHEMGVELVVEIPYSTDIEHLYCRGRPVYLENPLHEASRAIEALARWVLE